MHSTAPPSARRGAPVLYVAAAGYGKTAALDAAVETADDGVRIAAVEDLRLGGVLAGHHTVALDDLGDLTTSAVETALRALTGPHGASRLLLASRRPLPASARRLLPGTVFERGPADLALSPESVARVLRDEHGVQDLSLAVPVHRLTAGWPALVQFAADVLVRGGAGELEEGLCEPGTAAATWVQTHVLDDLPAWVAQALPQVGELEVVVPDLIDLPVSADEHTAASAVRWLRRTGLLVPLPRRRAHAAGHTLVPLLRSVILRGADAPQRRDPDRLRRTACWYAANGHPAPAARALVAAGDPRAAAELVTARGEEMLAAGEAKDVVDTFGQCRSMVGGTESRRLLADALRMSGDPFAALREFAPLVEAAETARGWPPGLAWRVAMVHYMLADYPAALDILDRADSTPGDGRDHVELLACRANVLMMLGREPEAAQFATAAVDASRLLGEQGASAAAHLSAANSATGPASERHLAQALAAAERAEDVVLKARIHLNHAFGLLMAASFDRAREAASEAVRWAELGSPPGLRVVALHNLADAERRLGRFVDAELHLRRAMAISDHHGLSREAFGLLGLAEIHHELGRREQAALAYDDAVAAARDAHEVQVLVQALSGLARLQAEVPEQVSAARATVTEAIGATGEDFEAYAMLARGWVALAEGDATVASADVDRALQAARESSAYDALAEALELASLLADHPRRAREALNEALAIWESGGADPSADRVRVLLGRVAGADGAARAQAREATRRLRRLGIDSVHGRPLDGAGTAAVDVRVLGGFEVLVAGSAVPLPAWRSKQARTLLKILVARRGRVVARAEVCELLWPDEDPGRTGHRLSVLLSAVRGVLDPRKAWSPDHFVRAEQSGLALVPAHARVDVEQLLADSAYAGDLLREGDLERAGDILGELVEADPGEAFEDEPYAEWADGLREQARAARQRCLRNLAEIRARTGDGPGAAVLLVRLLALDPYDEWAHRSLVRLLVASGRHGEARRALARWRTAMREIDAPEPDEGLLDLGGHSLHPGAIRGPARSAQPPGGLVLTPR